MLDVLHLNGIIVPITSNADVTVSSDFIAEGLTVYQTVTIINYGDYVITLPHSNLIQNINNANFDLQPRSSIKYIWNGVCWKQL